MKIWALIWKEALHRRLNFASGLLSVVVASGCVIGALSLLAAHDTRTEALILEKEVETRQAMHKLEDDYRRIMRDMGYNVLILHKDQDIGKLHRTGVADAFMPDVYAQRLAEGGIQTLNHLLPVLQQIAWWKEREIEIMVAGVRGQMPIAHRVRTGGVGPDGTPIMEPVPFGKADVGYGLAERFGLKEGDVLLFNGTDMIVNKRLPRRGTREDMTLWVHLDQAQAWFGRPGQINGIFALECVCQADALGRIVADVQGILPDVQVFEFSSLVQSRALARNRAAQAHREAIDAERRSRDQLRKEREQMAFVLVPLAIAGAGFWIFLGTMANVRERRSEIGLLRALGFGSLKIIGLFQGRTVAMSLIGAMAGYGVGILAGGLLGGAPIGPLLSPIALALTLFASVVLGCLAAYFPALKAARQDPAEILREIT